jgi:hypothetical protein
VLSIKFRLLQLSIDEVQDWIGCISALGASEQRKVPAPAGREKPVAEPVYSSLNWLNHLELKMKLMSPNFSTKFHPYPYNRFCNEVY